MAGPGTLVLGHRAVLPYAGRCACNGLKVQKSYRKKVAR
jgi:hypothetical protein